MAGNAAITAGFAHLTHVKMGEYPEPIQLTGNPRREIAEVLLIWGIMFASIFYLILAKFTFSWFYPSIVGLGFEFTLHFFLELLFPVCFVVVVNKWRPEDLGFRRPRARNPTIIAILYGVGWGAIPVLFGPVDPVPVTNLLFGIYSPAFIEEFVHRGIIQAKLERGVGTVKAWVIGGLLFGLIHVPTDFFGPIWFAGNQSLVYSFLALGAQVAAGWLWGVIYAKSRSLLPVVASHYFADFMPGILVWLL